MTTNTDIRIKPVALKLFVQWLKRVNIPEVKFCLVFVAPTSVESNLKKQSFKIDTDEVKETSRIKQFVARLDPFVEKKK